VNDKEFEAGSCIAKLAACYKNMKQQFINKKLIYVGTTLITNQIGLYLHQL